MVYVTTNPGKSLSDYNGRTVAVYGPTMYREDAVRDAIYRRVACGDAVNWA